MKSIEGGSRHSGSIQPIETRYHDRHFRSRIEARWAVFLDIINVAWEYEPEKYNVGDGKAYIPDFYLPHLGAQDPANFKRNGLFLEVKGSPPDEEAIEKAVGLADQTAKSVLLVWGGEFESGREITPNEKIVREMCAGSESLVVRFRQCPMCGLMEAGEMDHHFCMGALEIAKQYNIYYNWSQNLECGVSPLLSLAKEAAKSARFESPEWREELKGILLSAQRMIERRIFCDSQMTTDLLKEAQSWKDGGGGPYDEPWFDRHGNNLAKRVTPCDCYHCECDRNAKRA